MKYLWKAWFPDAPEEGYQAVEASSEEEAVRISKGGDPEVETQAAPFSMADLDRACREAKLEAMDDMKANIAALEHSAKEMA